MKTIWHAELETRNHSFQATGDTREHALEAMRLCWKSHAEQYARSGVAVAPFEEFLEDGSGLNVNERPLNQGFRDGEELGPVVDIEGPHEGPLDSNKLQLSQLHEILKAAQRARDDFAEHGKEGCMNPYAPGVQFKAWHMTFIMLVNPGMRPY